MSPAIFAVCPHDTARGFEKWALLNTFVNKHVALGGRFQLYLSFAELTADLEREKLLWAYLNPADFLKARTHFGYLPVVRPQGRFDVAYLVGALAAGRPQEVASGCRIAAVKGYLFWLFEHRLRQEGLAFTHVPAKSYSEAMTLVERGAADFCVTYNEHFDALAPAAREPYVLLRHLDPGLAHVVVAHPSLAAEARGALAELLLGAAGAADGRKMLAELGMTGFERVPDEPYEELARALAEVAS